MKAYEYIISKQTQWALNRSIPLIGSRSSEGRPAYVTKLEDNLFEPLDPTTRESFERGDGNEIGGNPSKMQALHSSAALSVNVFQYWQSKQVSVIASACGLCRKGSIVSEEIVFEDKYLIDDDLDKFPKAPNIDVVFHNSDSTSFKRFAVECKFSEAYSSRIHSGLKPAYLDLVQLWSDIPNLYNFAKSICPNENFIYLHSAQLIKHILGLKRRFGKSGFRLLYLWYDVLGKDGAIHRDEIEKFSRIAKADSIYFHAMSYQELILIMSKEHRQAHPNYIKYLSERYL
jgi:restriction endonuclease-like protein